MFEQMLDREKDKKFDDPSQKEIAYSNHISVYWNGYRLLRK